MIVGNPSAFAIESCITRAYERLSFRALGFFVIHIGARSFGVRASDATMLACSLDAVEARLARRGSHTASFVTERAGEIADAVRCAIYAEQEGGKTMFGLSGVELAELVHTNRLLWAPDGDEAFDDGSYVLQFDAGDRVRVIGFRCLRSGAHDPETLADIWVDHHEFYRTLTEWRDSFRVEWESLPKELA